MGGDAAGGGAHDRSRPRPTDRATDAAPASPHQPRTSRGRRRRHRRCRRRRAGAPGSAHRRGATPRGGGGGGGGKRGGERGHDSVARVTLSPCVTIHARSPLGEGGRRRANKFEKQKKRIFNAKHGYESNGPLRSTHALSAGTSCGGRRRRCYPLPRMWCDQPRAISSRV